MIYSKLEESKIVLDGESDDQRSTIDAHPSARASYSGPEPKSWVRSSAGWVGRGERVQKTLSVTFGLVWGVI